MQSMADSYAKRTRSWFRDLSIAQYQQQAATADLNHANQLWRF